MRPDLSFVIIVLTVVFFFGAIALFPGLPICHSSDVLETISVSDPIFSPIGNEVVFTAYLYQFRPAVGICKFLGGGVELPVDGTLGVLTVSTESGTVQKKAAIPISNTRWFVQNYVGKDSHHVLGWEDKLVYLSIGFTQTDGTAKFQLLKVDINNGTAEQISLTEKKAIQEKFWGQAKLSPTDQTLWVDYSFGIGIGLFRGEDIFQIDYRNKLVGQQGWPSNPERLLLSEQDISQLSALLKEE